MARAMNTGGRMGASGSAASPGTQRMGGAPQSAGSAPGRRDVILGDEVYLWLLVFLEVSLIAYFRATFSRYHGG